MNSVCLTGRIATDLELNTTGNGVEYINFRLAVNRDYKNKDGKYDADFFDITAWRKTAVFIHTYMKKGSAVEVIGQLETDHWTTDTEENRSKVKIKANSITWVPSQPKGGSDIQGAVQEAAASYAAPSAPAPQAVPATNLIEDDEEEVLDDGDLPF